MGFLRGGIEDPNWTSYQDRPRFRKVFKPWNSKLIASLPEWLMDSSAKRRFLGSIPRRCSILNRTKCRCNSVGRVSGCQSDCRRFEPDHLLGTQLTGDPIIRLLWTHNRQEAEWLSRRFISCTSRVRFPLCLPPPFFRTWHK